MNCGDCPQTGIWIPLNGYNKLLALISSSILGKYTNSQEGNFFQVGHTPSPDFLFEHLDSGQSLRLDQSAPCFFKRLPILRLQPAACLCPSRQPGNLRTAGPYTIGNRLSLSIFCYSVDSKVLDFSAQTFQIRATNAWMSFVLGKKLFRSGKFCPLTCLDSYGQG